MRVFSGGDIRAPPIRVGCLLSLLIASSASAVSMAWTPIGDPGNPADSSPSAAPDGYNFCGDYPSHYCGAVPYAYSIGTYEVTNTQYAEFLNAKAAIADPFGLYNPNMANVPLVPNGRGSGITQTCSL